MAAQRVGHHLLGGPDRRNRVVVAETTAERLLVDANLGNSASGRDIFSSGTLMERRPLHLSQVFDWWHSECNSIFRVNSYPSTGSNDRLPARENRSWAVTMGALLPGRSMTQEFPVLTGAAIYARAGERLELVVNCQCREWLICGTTGRSDFPAAPS